MQERAKGVGKQGLQLLKKAGEVANEMLIARTGVRKQQQRKPLRGKQNRWVNGKNCFAQKRNEALNG